MFKDIHGVFLDIEGTIRDNNRVIKKETIEIIDKLGNKGIHVILTSGLPRFLLKNVVSKVHASNYVVASNGADVYDLKHNKSIYGCYLNNTLVKDLIKCYRDKFNFILGVGDTEYATSVCEYNKNPIIIDNNNINNNFFQCHISQKRLMKADNVIEALKEIKNIILESDLNDNELIKYSSLNIDNMSDNEIEILIRAKRFIELKKLQKEIIKCCGDTVSVANQCIDFYKFNYYSETPWFSINNSDVCKGNGLVKACEYLNIPISERMAIGNDYNDRSMIDKVNVFLCPSDSCKYIIDRSKYIYDVNEGIDKVLRKVYKNNG